jgi:hypothetical protein
LGIFAAMKKLFFMGACLVALASQPVMAQTGKPDVVVVKVMESMNTMRIVVAQGSGTPQVQELDGGAGAKSMVSSSQEIQKVVAGLYAQGYSLKSTFGGNQGVLSTLIFVKGQ